MNNLEFQIEDLFEKYGDLFHVDFRIMACHPCRQMVYQWNELSKDPLAPPGTYVRNATVAQLVGFTTIPSEMDDAIAIIASKINTLCKLGYVLAVLSPLHSMELAKEAITNNGLEDNTINGEQKIVIMSYIFLTRDGEDWLKTNIPHLSFNEGGLPKIVG